VTSHDADRQRTRAITIEVAIDVPAAAIWSALTDPAEIARWFPPVVTGGGAAGQARTLTFLWGPPIEWTTTVAMADPGHVRWVDDPAAYEAAEGSGGVLPLAVDWHIEGRGGSSVVRLVHSGWDASSDWDEQYDATDAGWRYFLFNLRHYLTRHRGTPRTMLAARRPATIPRSELWDRLWGVDGFALSDADRRTLTAGRRAALRLRDGAQPTDVADIEVVHCGPTHFWGVLPGLRDALLVIEMEPGREGYHCGIWLSTYGVSKTDTRALDEALSALADRVFGPAPASAPTVKPAS
jgi:uncharacterized protein YndB with AHSA1/START domain